MNQGLRAFAGLGFDVCEVLRTYISSCEVQLPLFPTLTC